MQIKRPLHKFIGAGLAAVIYSLSMTPVLADGTQVTVWKTPTCGCCSKWVDYLSERGFEVSVNNLDDLSQVKRKLGLTDPSLHSCHTAQIENYVIEGHVPVSDIRRLLSERPDAVGLTAPGMPMLSPGMNSIKPKDYDVLLFNKEQNTKVFSSH